MKISALNSHWNNHQKTKAEEHFSRKYCRAIKTPTIFVEKWNFLWGKPQLDNRIGFILPFLFSLSTLQFSIWKMWIKMFFILIINFFSSIFFCMPIDYANDVHFSRQPNALNNFGSFMLIVITDFSINITHRLIKSSLNKILFLFSLKKYIRQVHKMPLIVFHLLNSIFICLFKGEFPTKI